MKNHIDMLRGKWIYCPCDDYCRSNFVKFFRDNFHEYGLTRLTATHIHMDGTPSERYDNCDAIDVSRTKDIPKDYMDVMGVPITYMDKHCPDQFEIVGKLNNPIVGGKTIYKRILIKRLK